LSGQAGIGLTGDIRAAFDIPRDICYLNASYMTPQPRRVLEAAKRGATRRSQPWKLKPVDFFTEVEALRALFARMVGCSPDNIAIVPSAGYGVACAASNTGLKPSDIVLGFRDQFPCNYYSWRSKANACGAELYLCDTKPGQRWADALLESIDRLGDRIAVASLEAHHWATAESLELERVIPALRDVGARVVLDLTQTIGACPVRIDELAPDFMVAAGYKWQLCPYGVSFLYVAEPFLDGVSIEEPWMARAGAEDFSRLSEFTDEYQAGARRFDMSEKSSFSNISGALAAHELLAEWGVENIGSVLARTNLAIAAILDEHGFETMPAESRAPHFQGARLPGGDPRALAAALLENGVYASVRGEYLRVAPYVYTDDEDMARFAEVLERAV
jgi:selenocysteine lyase/cysteine desulfurase